ncbi:Uncharacterized membrane protein YckC, RDD family [Thiothrix eikelboomii]|uniref:Uncharacterized membrane protein YckC, RDD family n=1 Tax=Thiothrix eikelboomii TaxID=92487 RepID=A0A1T4W8L2_9GAMM|nr:Uncharacterized membrane protein YckC, RDD family [Thiothrix eikelboomii]
MLERIEASKVRPIFGFELENSRMSVSNKVVSFPRRMAAVLYDTLLIGVTTAIIGGILATIVAQVGGIELHPGSRLSNLLFLLDLVIAFFLFGWFWTHGGQTLGMRAWNIKVVTDDGSPFLWPQAFFRYVGALFSWLALGVGFWMAIFDPQKLTWHDRFSRTHLIHTH